MASAPPPSSEPRKRAGSDESKSNGKSKKTKVQHEDEPADVRVTPSPPLNPHIHSVRPNHVAWHFRTASHLTMSVAAAQHSTRLV
jgi:hypothetical protein